VRHVAAAGNYAALRKGLLTLSGYHAALERARGKEERGFMSINDRVVMTQQRAFSSAALRIAVSGRHAAARGLNRRPACRCATHDHLPARRGNVTCPDSVSRP